MEDLASVVNEPKPPAGTARKIFVFEILSSAKKSCRLCFGVGVFSMTDNPKTPSHEEICGCAVRRFLKFHGNDVVANNKGEFFWLEGKDPLADQIAAAQAASSSTNTPEVENGPSITGGDTK